MQVKTGLDVIAVKKSETEGRKFEPQEEGGLLPSSIMAKKGLV